MVNHLLKSFCFFVVFKKRVSCEAEVVCSVQVPSLCEDLLSSVDQPLKITRDKVTGKDYLLCDYNRDGDSYRSSVKLHPWLWDATDWWLLMVVFLTDEIKCVDLL